MRYNYDDRHISWNKVPVVAFMRYLMKQDWFHGHLQYNENQENYPTQIPHICKISYVYYIEKEFLDVQQENDRHYRRSISKEIKYEVNIEVRELFGRSTLGVTVLSPSVSGYRKHDGDYKYKCAVDFDKLGQKVKNAMEHAEDSLDRNIMKNREACIVMRKKKATDKALRTFMDVTLSEDDYHDAYVYGKNRDFSVTFSETTESKCEVDKKLEERKYDIEHIEGEFTIEEIKHIVTFIGSTPSAIAARLLNK